MASYRDLSLVVLGALLVSSKGILVKFLYQEGVTTEASLLLRAWVSLPLIWWWAYYNERMVEVLSAPRGLIAGAMLAGVVSYYIAAWLDFVALSLIDAGLERILLFSYPVIVVIVRAVIARRLPSLRVLMALVFIYSGVVLAVGGLDAELWHQNRVGAGLVLLSACFFSYYLIANERYAKRAGSVGFIVYAVSAAAIALLIHFAIFNDFSELAISVKAWGYLLLMTTFTNVLPLFLFSEGIRRIGAERAAIISTIGPPATIALAAYLLGERMSAIQLGGAALIIVGIIVVEYRFRPPIPVE
ncbi:MAG: DMT family transporter [Gammaproteobacteria bacterium]